MAAGKNKKGKTNNGGSQANVQHHGLMALESRVLFSAAALVSDVPEPVNDAAAAIEVSQLTPVEDSDVETYAVMGINPDSMRPSDESEGFIKLGDIKGEAWTAPNADTVSHAMNQGPDLVPTPTPGGGSVMVINPDSMFPADEPEGSNPTPHPMPVPELSDSVSKRRLEHGPGLHDSVLDLVGMINPDSMRPTANSFRGCVPTDPCSMLLTPVEDSDVAALSGQTIGEADSFFDIFTELSRVGDEPRDIVDSAQVVNPDSMRPADAQRIGISPIPTPTPGGGSVMVINPDSMRPTENKSMAAVDSQEVSPQGLDGFINATSSRPVSVSPASQDFWVAPSWDASAGLHDSVLDSVLVINPDSMRPADNPFEFHSGCRKGSNSTPHPMPVPELSDSVSKRRLEHGPGLHDSVLDSVKGSNWNIPEMDMAPVQSGSAGSVTDGSGDDHTEVLFVGVGQRPTQ